ncbi:MAG: TPM domain-containing protein, partial [Firmicutes bacterium]|nr:TPM domain-containing protein [Bacillota bacterium]
MKKLFTIILAIIMCMAMTFNVYADSTKYVFDEAEKITTASEESLNAKAQAIYDKTGIVVSYVVVADAGSDGSFEYAKKAYKENFGKKDGILLIETDTKWSIYKQGKAEDIFSSKDEEKMWDACANADYYNEGVDAYLDVASGILSAEGVVAEKEAQPETEAVVTEEAAAPDPNHPVRLVDDADLLASEEEQDLLAKLNEISERQAVDVVVVAVDSLGGKTPEAFADDYFDYNGYGIGADRDGIIFVISMGERQMAMSTRGFGIPAFTDAGQDYIWDMITPYIGNESYAAAFNEFADLCDDFISQAKAGEPYDVGNMPDKVGIIGIIAWLIPSFLIAAVISLFLKKK